MFTCLTWKRQVRFFRRLIFHVPTFYGVKNDALHDGRLEFGSQHSAIIPFHVEDGSSADWRWLLRLSSQTKTSSLASQRQFLRFQQWQLRVAGINFDLDRLALRSEATISERDGDLLRVEHVVSGDADVRQPVDSPLKNIRILRPNCRQHAGSSSAPSWLRKALPFLLWRLLDVVVSDGNLGFVHLQERTSTVS